ncbi:MAG: P-type conjugative transfer ATPase TrbB [Proteobacteria bacterium]|nr:P-type conjugative transfer ATPase TrbB [Pseudomonadota bacterium]
MNARRFASTAPQRIVADRRLAALARAMGPALADALADPLVVEVLVNADGRVRVDRIGAGIEATNVWLTSGERETAVRLLAAEARITVTEDQPYLAATLPGSGARVQAMIPPLVAAPTLAIRKRPSAIFTLADYVRDRIADPAQAEALRRAIRERHNIVVAGGTGSGKTTLLNALLAEAEFASARIIILEDTAELQCAGADVVQLLTKRAAPQVTMRDLVQMTLRLRPDRIVVGEVRDAAALEVLKAWNTGHPGGLLTIHANSAADALMRLEDLCIEAGLTSPQRLIRSAVDTVVFMARTPEGRRIEEIAQLRAPRTLSCRAARANTDSTFEETSA